MYQVEGSYQDYTSPIRECSFHLNADKDFIPGKWIAPIQWGGTVGGIKVRFTQISSDSYQLKDFDWSEFPEQLEIAKFAIVDAINEAMRTMD